MAIPSESQIDETLQAVENLHAYDLLTKFSDLVAEHDGDKPPVDHILELLGEAERVLNGKLDAMLALPASKWLSNQAGFKLARQVGDKDRTATQTRFTHEQWLSKNSHAMTRWFATMLEANSVGRLANKQQKNEASDQFLNQFSTCVEMRVDLFEITLRCLKDYFYHDETEIALRYRNIDAVIEEAERGVMSIAQLLQCMCLPNSTEMQRSFHFHALRQLNKLVTDVKREGLELRMPLQRNDKTARERLLVSLLFWYLRQWNGSRNITVISHLLSIEGIQHRLDKSTLERMIRQWSTIEARRHP